MKEMVIQGFIPHETYKIYEPLPTRSSRRRVFRYDEVYDSEKSSDEYKSGEEAYDDVADYEENAELYGLRRSKRRAN
jgi:hypothetical protein